MGSCEGFFVWDSEGKESWRHLSRDGYRKTLDKVRESSQRGGRQEGCEGRKIGV